MSVAIYLFLLGVIGAIEIPRRRDLPIDLFLLINILFATSYGLVPLTFLLLTDVSGDHRSLYAIDGPDALVPAVILLGYCVFLIGWAITGRVGVLSSSSLQVPKERTVRLCLVVGAIVSLISISLYARSTGSFYDFVTHRSIARATGTHSELDTTAVFFHATPFAWFVSLYAFFRLIKGSHGNHLHFYLGLLFLPLLITVMVAVSYASRLRLFFLMVSFFIVFAHTKRKLRPWWYVTICLSILILLHFGKPFFMSMPHLIDGDTEQFLSNFVRRSTLRTATGNPLHDVIGRELAHCSGSVPVALQNAGTRLAPYTWFSEYPESVLHLVPRRLLGLDMKLPIRTSVVNTELISGENVSGIPPGIVAAFWYSGGMFGLCVGMLVYGMVGHIIQNLSYAWRRAGEGSIALSSVVFLAYAEYSIRAVPDIFIRTNAALFLALIGFSLYSILGTNLSNRDRSSCSDV